MEKQDVHLESEFSQANSGEVFSHFRRCSRINRIHNIQLYDSADARRQIAWFQTARKGTVGGVPTLSRALLVLQKEGQEILDAVIISLLIVEQRLRWREMKYRNADGRNTFQH